MESSEQKAGFIALLIVAWVVGSLLTIQIAKPVPECISVQRYKYEGRSEQGRPMWSYPTIEVCYE